MHVLGQGPVATANNPSVAVLARVLAARRAVAAADAAEGQPAPVATPIATPPRLRTIVIEGNVHAVRTALLNPSANPHEPDRVGRTLLHYALENGHLGVTLALLQASAVPNSRDADGTTPLDHAEYWATRAQPPQPPSSAPTGAAARRGNASQTPSPPPPPADDLKPTPTPGEL